MLAQHAPPLYVPFKFDSRRVRIDWRLLHGVDISKLVCQRAAGWGCWVWSVVRCRLKLALLLMLATAPNTRTHCHTHQIQDTDLDTLEALASCITWGDIEAEDSRHLTEGSFVKVFRLAQLLLEYLLYVQDTLKATNASLDASRCAC